MSPWAAEERAPAKVNLLLEVAGRRTDGFHDLTSLIVFADLSDRISMRPASDWSIALEGPFAAALVRESAPDNLMVRAARRWQADCAQPAQALAFTLEKNIPVAAGLGGGSSDAAAVFRMLQRRHANALADPDLMAAALSLGADVPVCLGARPAIVEGKGELIRTDIDLPGFALLLANPGVPLSTAAVFAKFDVLRPDRPDTTPLGAIPAEFAPFADFLQAARNDLEPAASALEPRIAELLAQLRGLPDCRLARMSGSGATCFGLFESWEMAVRNRTKLSDRAPGLWLCACRPFQE